MGIFENGRVLTSSASGAQYLVKDYVNLSDSTVNQLFSEKWESSIIGSKVKNKAQSVWVKIPIKNISPSTNWLVINDHHINELKIWIVKDNKIIQSFPITGDHFPFSSRQYPSIDFVYKIPVNHFSDCELIIASDKRHVKNILPIQFYSDYRFFKQSENKNIFYGILLGLVFIMLVYNFSLFFSTRLPLFVCYGIYLCTILLYFSAEMGYFFQYVIPEAPHLNDVFPIGVIAFSIIPFIVFFNQMLDLKKNKPVYYKINYFFLVGFSIILVAGLWCSYSGNFVEQGFWLMVYRFVSPTFLLILMAESVYCFKKKIPFSTYTTLSVGSFILMSIVYMFHDAGYLPANILTSNAFIVGIIIEIFIMTLAISARFKSYKKESELLLKVQQNEKDQIIKSVTTFKEQEMQRFSNLLHDSVGARLSAIRLNIEALNNNDVSDFKKDGFKEITKDISDLADDVRIFSHQISPMLLEKNGLIHTIKNLTDTVTRSGMLHIQLETLGSLNSISFQYELMVYNILQELIQNIIRHAKANEAIVQVILEKELVSVFVEDNGIGFDVSNTAEGLGLMQIKKLITFVNGSINIKSAHNKGTTISIEFKIKNNEETH